jgi:hypothetical protein
MKYIFVLFICLGPAWLFGNKDSLSFAVEITGDYSYAGGGTGVGLVLIKQKNEFCLRARTSLTYLTRHNNTPYGFGIGYRNIFVQKKHFRSFMEIEYQNLFFKIYSYVSETTHLYQAHELYLGYGTGFRFGRFIISNTISYGAYAEVRFEPNENDEEEFFYHLSPKIKLNLAYEF